MLRSPLAYDFGQFLFRPHVRSFIAIETGLPGFGLEILADPSIAWYFGTIAKPGAAERFFKGRERELLTEFVFIPPTTATAIGTADIEEFISGYARAGGWTGAQSIYDSNLREIADYKAMVAARPLAMPLLVVDRDGSDFTARSFAAAAPSRLKARSIANTGHYIAMEAPLDLAAAMLEFTLDIDQANERM